jgi:hypothetical protein
VSGSAAECAPSGGRRGATGLAAAAGEASCRLEWRPQSGAVHEARAA